MRRLQEMVPLMDWWIEEKISRPEFGPDSSGPFLCAQAQWTGMPLTRLIWLGLI